MKPRCIALFLVALLLIASVSEALPRGRRFWRRGRGFRRGLFTGMLAGGMFGFGYPGFGYGYPMMGMGYPMMGYPMFGYGYGMPFF